MVPPATSRGIGYSPVLERFGANRRELLQVGIEIDLGIVAITQILTTPGVQYVGPLPPEVQSYITFTGGISANSHAPNVARDLFKFLTGPTAIPVIKSQGMEPG
jgi:ABC-type molybdate transport system substrate-binding protein